MMIAPVTQATAVTVISSRSAVDKLLMRKSV
jgi:hypothetical protein